MFAVETSRRVFLTEDTSSAGLAKPKAGDLAGTVQTPSVSRGDEGYFSNAGDDFFVLLFGTVYFVVSKLSMCNLLFSSELSMTF